VRAAGLRTEGTAMNASQRYVVSIGLLISASAYAQTDPALVADEVVVTASRFEEKPGDQPIGVTVISADEIRSSGETSLPRLLARQPGVFVRDNSGSPDMQVDLRGFGITGDQNTLVLLDGRRLSEHELTTARWSAIPIESIERIEILRGSGAVLYGGGATGGVINVITKGADRGGKSFDAYAGAGSYKTRDYRIGGQIAGETVGLDLHGGRYTSDNYRENNRVDQDNFVANLRNFDPDHSLNLSLGYDKQDLRLPGFRTEAELTTDRRGTNTPTDFSNRWGGFANFSGTFRLGESELIIDLGYREKNNDFHSAFFGLSLDGNTKVDTSSFSPRLKTPYSAFGVNNSLIVGLDWEGWDYSSTRTNPASVSARQRNSAAYLQNVSTLGKGTILSIGGRLQRIDFDADDSTIAVGGDQNRNPTAYEIALRHQWNDATAIYGKYGYSFRVATLDEIYSPGLGAFFISPSVTFIEPQTSHDAELGLEAQSGPGRYRIAVYQFDLNNEIHFDPVTFANVNLPPTKRSGLELEGNWTLATSASLFANYTYSEAYIQSGTLGGVAVAGNRIPLVPRHMANVGIDWSMTERTRLNAAAHYVGTQLYDNDELNTFGREMPAYWTVDLGMFHTVDAWTFGASVKNLFDEKYYTYALATFPSFIAYPAPERNFLVSAQYRFAK
jgi:iron complex outermembrane receptor protein